jgi:hypothetical protein
MARPPLEVADLVRAAGDAFIETSPGVSEDLLASSGANRRDDLTAERAQ